jgi:thioredoxin-dependent peroxiredoxin
MYPALQEAGVEVVGISTDGPETLDRFRRERELPFALVSDASGKIARAYGARWPILGLARRVTYLVGRDRRVRLAFRSERDFTAHPERVLREATGG